MNSHLAIKINGKYVPLKPDTSIDVEDTNPYFNDVQETFSYSFAVPIKNAMQVIGDVATIEGDARLTDIENLPMEIEVDGISFRNGKVSVETDQELREEVNISLVSAVKSLNEYFEGLKCRDVDVPHDYKNRVGITLGNFNIKYSANVNLWIAVAQQAVQQGWKTYEYCLDAKTIHEDIQLEQKLPTLGFTRPDNPAGNGDEGKEPSIIDKYTNVVTPYPDANFCSARVCYDHYKKKDNGESSDELDTEYEDSPLKRYNPYLVLDAERQGSGICFYVLYFLDLAFALLKEDGVVYDNSELKKVDDLCRLAFFTTACKYDLLKDSSSSHFHMVDTFKGWGNNFDLEQANLFLRLRNMHGSLSLEKSVKNNGYINIDNGFKFAGSSYKIDDTITFKDKLDGTLVNGLVRGLRREVTYMEGSVESDVMYMYANSMNLPNDTIQSVIDSLWASFGIRFFLDQENRTVKPRFIRDVLNDSNDPVKMYGTVYEAVKLNEKITGVRMKYSAESDSKEQRENIRNGSTDYDTIYDYIDYQNIVVTDYAHLLANIHDSNMNLYVDRTTGNLYRIKIDKDAETRDEYKPQAFRVGQYKGVEIGDCSDENSDYIEELTSSFVPMVFNDVNGRDERLSVYADSTFNNISLNPDKNQLLAAYVSEDMWCEDVERIIAYPLGNSYLDFSLKAKAKTVESYDPSNSDNGESPLQSIDWGLAVSVMRGGGSNARISYYDQDYDGFGNEKWATVAGDYMMDSDVVDCWGNVYDYNGQNPGLGGGERFSLSIRNYIEAPYDIPAQGIKKGDVLCDKKVANRGLFDTFMAPYAYFLLNRKLVRLKYRGQIAELQHIQWDRRYTFGEYTGWINKINTHITVEGGIEETIIELFVL